MMLRPVAGRGLVLGALLLALVPAPARAVETVRIHVGDAEDTLEIRGPGLSFGFDVEDEEAPATAVPKDRAVIKLVRGRLQVDGAPWPEPQVRFRTAEEGAPLRALRHEVRGDVVVRVHRDKLQVINVVPLEDYLAAVLGSEMPSTFPPEALKAQAVAARTYALHKKLEAYGQPFHLGASVLHQVYGGVAREDPRTKAAVEATRGEVLTWELQPIEAYFHASCGGRTEEGVHALGRDLPYLPAVTCPCSALPQSRWEAKVPVSELRGAFGGSKLKGVRVQGRTRTGRVNRIATDSGRSVDGVSFRARVGYSRIRSLHFDVKPAGPDVLQFSGRGYGHGAGLCQWGAKALADGGSGYTEILAHYYPGTELQTLY